MKKLLEIKKGDEYRSRIEKEFKNTDIFKETYIRAVKILSGIIEEEKSFSEERRADKGFSKVFQGMSNNIIVFCAERGQGKTSAMLSFARLLKNDLEKNGLAAEMRENDFYVLDSIDPSALDKEESIIQVIMSRLFYTLTEKMEKENFASDVKSRREMEKILELFQKCYDNIQYLQNEKDKKEYQDDLEHLAQLGDSSKLKENLYDLIGKFLESTKTSNDKKDKFLVIPVDDADLSVQSVFHICEDIRKYLSIPNVIILMAANFEQLNYAILQNYLSQYKVINEMNIDGIDMKIKCTEMTAKYLEKMFPSGHRLELPDIESIIQKRSYSLQLSYIIDDMNVFESWNETCKDMQEQLLRLLYSKTGVALLKGDEQLNSFLPRTLRELTHFVRFLNDMEDVNLNIAYQKLDVLSKNENEQKIIEQEWEKLRLNLQLLKQYYFNCWRLNSLKISEQEKIGELEKKERNALRDFIKIELTKSESIRLYYTIYMNECLAEALDKDNREQIEKIRDFSTEVLEISKSIEEQSTRRYWKNYQIDGFELEYEKIQKFFQMEKMDARKISVLESCCSLEFKENYNGTKRLITKNGNWNKNITKIRFEILKSLMAFIDTPHLLFESKTPNHKPIEKEESGADFQMEQIPSSELLEEQTGKYISGVKDIIANYDLWCVVSKRVNEKYEEFEEKDKLKWYFILQEIYKVVDDVYNDKIRYLSVRSFTCEEFIIKGFSRNFWEKVFLCNKENLKSYLDSCDEAFEQWINSVLEILNSLLDVEKMNREEVSLKLKDLKELQNKSFTEDLMIELSPEMEESIQSNWIKYVEEVKTEIKKVINNLEPNKEKDLQDVVLIKDVKKKLNSIIMDASIMNTHD